MNFNALAYPDVVFIEGLEYKAKRDMFKEQVSVPYTETPDLGIGDVIIQKSGKREIHLKVIDVQFLEGGTLKVGTKHPHLLKLHVENTTSQSHKTSSSNTTTNTINIGSISGEQFQVGNNNTQSVTINVKKLVEEIIKSNDPEAKSLLKKLLENSTVGSVIGAGASALISML